MKNQVRIIGGRWRGRKISFPEHRQVRPTPDRVKETLFNWLAPYIIDAHCLELFAGSASLSFEALSRQAKTAVAVEKDRDTIQDIQKNKDILNAEALEIINTDCFIWLKTTQPSRPFDIAFIDPPYALNGLPESFELINNPAWLQPNALIYFESHIPMEDQLPANWTLLKNKRAGQVLYYLVQVTF